MPVSSTTIAAPFSRNSENAMAVMVSKYVGCMSIPPAATSRSAAAWTRSNAAANSPAVTGSPATRMRSVGSARCGDTNRPVRTPAMRSERSIMAHVEPLPLVPATCTKRLVACGCPSAASSVRILSRPNLMVLNSLPRA